MTAVPTQAPTIEVVVGRIDKIEQGMMALTDNVNRLAEAQAKEQQSNQDLSKNVDRLVSVVENRSASADSRMDRIARDYAESRAPKWGTLISLAGLGLASITAVCSLYAWGLGKSQDSSDKRITTLEGLHNQEMLRNNEIERRLSKTEAVIELYKAGMLVNPQPDKKGP